MERIFTHISGDITYRWTFLARSLGLSDSDIRDLENNTKESREKIYRMLVLWKSQKGIYATIECLKNALRENDMNMVADKVSDLERCSAWTQSMETFV